NLKRPSGPKARLVSRQEEGVSSKEATSAVRPSRIRSGFTPSLRTATPSKREAPRQTTELRRPQPRLEDDDELDLPTNPMDAAEVAAVTRSHDPLRAERDRKSTRLNSSHVKISYAVFCLKKKTKTTKTVHTTD